MSQRAPSKHYEGLDATIAHENEAKQHAEDAVSDWLKKKEHEHEQILRQLLAASKASETEPEGPTTEHDGSGPGAGV